MKTITLGELLTEEQGKEVARILNESGDYHESTHRLKKYLSQFKEQLEAKGVLYEYLAYGLPYWLQQGALHIPVPGHR